jgi:4-amino-4-deoxy-L-arabinose transferase-like glycosyltransferase
LFSQIFHSSLFTLKHGFWWCSLAIVVLLCMPWMGLGTEAEDVSAAIPEQARPLELVRLP